MNETLLLTKKLSVVSARCIRYTLLISCCALLLLAFVRHLRPGHFFSEDYAVYLKESLNLLRGKSLTEMGIVYWFDPNLPLIGQSPFSYPILVPALFALPVSVFGLDLEVLKLFQAGIAVVGLAAAAAAMLKSGLTRPEVLTSLLLFALAPALARDANTIGADLPFILCQAAVLLAALALQRAPTRANAVQAGIILGVTLWLSISTRTVAVAFVPAIILADLVVHRRVRLMLLVPISVAVALWFIQSSLVGQGNSYGYIASYKFFDVAITARTLLWALANMLQQSPVSAFATPIVMLLTILVGVGVVVRATVGCPIAWWLATYTALLLVLPNFNAGTRYLVPHLVFGGAFAVRGTWTLLQAVPLRATVRRIVALLPTLGFVGLCALVPTWPPGPLPFGVRSSSSLEAFAHVISSFAPDEIVATTVHRSVHLYTARTTIRPPEASSATQLRAWFDRNAVAGLVLKHSASRGRYDFTDCPASSACRVSAEEFGMTEVFRNEDWIIWRR